MKGLFITLEGGEGGGKTTQARLVAETLRRDTGREVICTRSPGGTEVAERIRDILKTAVPGEPLLPETELLLFAACHAQMCEHLIRPAMERGAILISDRYVDSTVVYQGCARGIPAERILELNHYATKGLLPDLTIVLDLPVSSGKLRISHRAGDVADDRFDSESLQFFEHVRNGFLQLARKEPERVRVVDAAQEISMVTDDILKVIYEKLDRI